MYLTYSFLCALGFSLIHFFSKYMKFAGRVPRSRFLSFEAGVAVSYVFVHLLPELSEYQEAVAEQVANPVLRYIENQIYIVAMGGLVLFYVIEQLVRKANHDQRMKDTEEPGSVVFWLQMASFFLYNAIIGYLLVRGEFSLPLGLLFYFLALGVHFVTNDWSLRRHHKEAYDKYGRTLLSLSPVIGWTAGVFAEISIVRLSVLQAFIAGGVILNVMKEELPEEQQSSITSFLGGVTGYTILLLLT